jgi:hypothetical protein
MNVGTRRPDRRRALAAQTGAVHSPRHVLRGRMALSEPRREERRADGTPYCLYRIAKNLLK